MRSTRLKSLTRGQEPAPCLVDHFAGHKGSVLCLSFHPNLEMLFSGSSDGSIMTWSYKNRNARSLKFEGHAGPVNDVCFSRFGELMASGSSDQTIRVWVPAVNGDFVSVKGHSASVRSVSFSPTDSSTFASASNDKTVKVWSVLRARTKAQKLKLRTYDFVTSFAKHTNWVNSVRYSPNGTLLTSCSDDKTIRVYDLRSRECALTLTSYLGVPTKAAFNPCGEQFIGASTDEKSFLMFDVRGTTDRSVIQCYENIFEASATDFTFDPTGDFAVCVSDDKRTKILDLIEGRPIFTLHGPKEGLCTVAYQPDGKYFATGGKDKNLHVWEPVLIPYKNDSREESLQKSSRSNSSSQLTASSSYGSNKENQSSRDVKELDPFITDTDSESVKTLSSGNI